MDLNNRLRLTRFRRQLEIAIVAVALLALAAPVTAAPDKGPLGNFKHLVVIYEENHSFDNLYGLWGDVNGQQCRARRRRRSAHDAGRLDGPAVRLPAPDRREHAHERADLSGQRLGPSHRSRARRTCSSATARRTSHYERVRERAIQIDDFIGPTDVTCPPLTNLFGFANGIDKTNPVAGATAGGCTRDLVHRFYQEQYQLNGGA